MAVLFLLLASHLVVAVKFCLDVLHDTAQGAGLRQVDVLWLTAFHIGNLVAYTACLACEDSIGDTAPYTHEFGQVHISGEAVVLFELAVGRELYHLRDVAEVADKIVKVVDAVGFHRVNWHEITHERPYLGGCVGDRRTSRKHYVASVIALHDSLRL